MAPNLKVIEFPERDVRDLPRGLRLLAERIEGGDYADAHNLAWVIDCGDGRVDVGMLGGGEAPGATAHFLFALAQRKIEAL